MSKQTVEWISAEEELPEDNGDVLLTIQEKGRFHDKPIIAMGYCDEIGWWVHSEDGGINWPSEMKVIAWASLPDPYMGDVKDECDAQMVQPESCFKVWAPLPAPHEGGKKNANSEI